MKLLRCLAALTAGAALFVACGSGEEVVVGCDPCPPPSFKSLTQRWHVLNNLQLAYNEREATRVDELLDQNFIFYVHPFDVGGIIPPQWERDEEMAITTMLFDPGLAVPGYPTCQGIRMDIGFEKGVAWQDTISPAYPGETLSMATLYYDFDIAMDHTFVAMSGSRAQFILRNIGTAEAPQWRLVEWRDLAPSSGPFQSARPASVEETTWSHIKTFYFGTTAYLPLSQRDQVLNNLEVSYNQRKLGPFAGLIDQDFRFFFWPGDVGGVIPEQWGRIDELNMATFLFDPFHRNPSYPHCSSIDVDLEFENGVNWIEVVPEDRPTETWYTTTVGYDFTFKMWPDQTYLAIPSARAQFTVRNAGTDDAPQWRLVEWRDLGGGALLAAASTQSTTWGAIKALYPPGGGS